MNARPSASDLPRGFTFAATPCELKGRSGLDLALFVGDVPIVAAAMFTTNCVQAAPVIASQAHMQESHSKMRAVIANSGNANCCTGADGTAAAAAISLKVAHELGRLHPSQVLVCSTGVIGVLLHVEKTFMLSHNLFVHAAPARAPSRKSRAQL
jgi:glutamate N-acetyltransferase/amino-acid N-acetyltransferase